MRALRMTALIGLLVLTACQADRQATEPTGPTERVGPSLNNSTSACPSAAKLLVQIVVIVKPGQGRLATAIIKFNQIILALVQHNTVKAQQRMFELLDFLIQEYNNGNLIGGKSTGTQTKLTTLTNGLYCIVGLPAPVIPAGALTADGAIGVVNNASPTTTLINSTMLAGVQIPANAASSAVLVTISRINPSTPPLLTPLDQYPAFYEYHASPEGAFGSDVTIGVCVGTGASPAVFPRLKIAHNVGTGVELLNQVPLPFTLDCSTLGLGMGAGEHGLFGLALRGLGTFRDLMLPQVAQASTVGTCCVGGTTKKFSPFGAVDTLVIASAVSPTSIVGAAGSYVANNLLPSVRVLTPSGDSVAGLTVTFSVPPGSGDSIHGPVQVTDVHGIATVGAWFLTNPGADSVLATVTPPHPGSGVQNNEILFTATVFSGEVPFQSSGWFYKQISSFDPVPSEWTTIAPTVANGWTPGSAPFGTPGCGLPTPATPWTVGTTMLLRRDVFVPLGTTSMKVDVLIDNDLHLFVNGWDISGGLIFNGGCADGHPLSYSIYGPAFEGHLVPGQVNQIFIRGVDEGVQSYLDAKITFAP